MKDLDGYLVFLEDESWSDPRDRNQTTVNDEHRSRFAEYLESLKTPGNGEGHATGRSPSEFQNH
jgi:hypothetical protein